MTGRVSRVDGPLVELTGLDGVAMSEVVELGAARLPAEVVAIRGGRVTAQAYEYTGGLAPGAVVEPRGEPLAARLGPHLLGGIFDGLLRPLRDAPTWLVPGVREQDATTSWHFVPDVGPGAVLGGGELLGRVPAPRGPEHRVLAPPGGGVVTDLVPAGGYTGDDVLARVGGVPVSLMSSWPVRRPRPYRERLEAAQPLRTGQRVLDVLFPVALGGTASVPGGFGTGKTVLLQQVAKWCTADVLVYVGCGERGNELADVVQELSRIDDPRTGGRLAERTVIVANTSNMPMMAREASIYTGVTVAEYFRDMGRDAVVIADSTSRWAEALREFASRSGALPAEEGYPADLASALAAFYERAGVVTTLGGDRGSVTIIGAVSPPGGDMAEPVTVHTQRFVRALWSLDRQLAYSRHYPALGWADSFSRDVPPLSAWHTRQGDPRWAGRRARVVARLAEADRLAAIAELVGVGSLPASERVALLAGRLLREGVLQQSALSSNDAFCPAGKAAALTDLVLDVIRACEDLVAHGLPASVLEEADLSPVLRAREEVGPDDAAGLAAVRDGVLARLRGLAS